MVKKSVWIATGGGLLTTVAALIIQMNYVILQTEPTPVDRVVIGVSTFLLIIGAILLSEAIWDLKQKISRVLVFILIAIGLVGMSAPFAFHNSFVDFFFPRLSIISFLLTDFMVVALFGILLLIFGQLPVSNDK
jgi:hypothetical protein